MFNTEGLANVSLAEWQRMAMDTSKWVWRNLENEDFIPMNENTYERMLVINETEAHLWYEYIIDHRKSEALERAMVKALKGAIWSVKEFESRFYRK